MFHLEHGAAYHHQAASLYQTKVLSECQMIMADPEASELDRQNALHILKDACVQSGRLFWPGQPEDDEDLKFSVLAAKGHRVWFSMCFD